MTRALALVLIAAALACTDQRVCGAHVGESVDVVVDDGCTPLAQASNTDAGTPPSGLESCETGAVDRVAAVPCELCYDVRLCDGGPWGCDPGCGDGEICAAGAFGSCNCVHPCGDDDDCGTGSACICPTALDETHGIPRAIYPTCVPASCRTNDDCGENGRCGLSVNACSGPAALDCRGADDECSGADACPQEGPAARCIFSDDDGHFICDTLALCE